MNLGDTSSRTSRSFPVHGARPDTLASSFRIPADGVPEARLGIPEGADPAVVDSHLRDMEVTVLKLFGMCWVNNPRIDPANPANVVVDGVSMSPSVLRDEEIINAVVHCAARIFRIHGMKMIFPDRYRRKA